jgi:hypothetical protein
VATLENVYFRLGYLELSLEIPPFFVNFDKRDFSSMMSREKKEGRKALFYVYISRKNHLSKLLLLKAMHPDIFIPNTLIINEKIDRLDIDSFIRSVKKTNKEWSYRGMGIWRKDFFEIQVFMVLILGKDRWTIRPLISKKDIPGFGVEIPIEQDKCNSFLKELDSREKVDLDVHEHVENRHFHFTVFSVERYINLIKKWDYYFSRKERWKQTVRIKNIAD